MPQTRNDLLKIYQSAIDAVGGQTSVSNWLQQRQLSWRDCGLLAVGKAAVAMTNGALDALPDRIISGLLISKDEQVTGNAKSVDRIRILNGDHPLPGARSLAAGEEVIDYINSLPPAQPLLVLISGGASSLLEVLPEPIDLKDLIRVNDWLLASGYPIARMNAIRQRLSAIKGGRLAAMLGNRSCLCLLISDVEGDDPAVIGSGPMIPSAGIDYSGDRDLPDWLRLLLASVELPSVPENADVEVAVVASLHVARSAAAKEANALGYRVFDSPEFLKGDAQETGVQLVKMMADLPGVLHIWGGETTVKLPQNPGRGGRCQALALAAAVKLTAHPEGSLLAAGTDGGDGPGGDAGALVDAGTLARGEQNLMNVHDCLQRADSGSFLESSGDLIHTGPTGTNVMDLVLGIIRTEY